MAKDYCAFSAESHPLAVVVLILDHFPMASSSLRSVADDCRIRSCGDIGQYRQNSIISLGEDQSEGRYQASDAVLLARRRKLSEWKSYLIIHSCI